MLTMPFRFFLGCALPILVWGQAGAASVLNFPRISFEADTITGVAIANPGTADAQVTLSLYGVDGALLQAAGLVNPQQVPVPAGRQFAQVTAAIFGGSLPASTVGWMQAVSDAEDLTGFFLFLDSAVTFFDGADLPPASRRVLFNEVRVDSGFSTELNLVNPSQQAVTVVLRLLGGAAPVIRNLELPGRGVARLDAATFFGVAATEVQPAGAAPPPARYVVAESDGLGVAGFGFVRGPGDLLGQNAVALAEPLTTLYFPQLAVLGAFRTQLVVTNSGDETAILTISARRPDGSLFGAADLQVNPVTVALPAGAVLREDLEGLFGFSGAVGLEGWLQVDSSAQSVSGSISYTIPANNSLAAVGSLTQGSRRAIFSHIATSANFFTGVALLNTSSFAANYRITALRPDGSVLGSFNSLLRPGQRVSRLIDELISAAAGQAGGLILVQSDVPLFLTSLFGSTATGILANIPPQPVPASFDPAPGPSPRVSPSLTVLGPTESQTFSLTGGSGSPTWSVNGMPGGSAASGFISPAGQFTAPALVPELLPVTVSAESGASQAGASVDIISGQELAGGLGVVRSVAYLQGLNRVYASEVEGAGVFQRPPGDGVQGALSSTVYDVTSGTRLELASFPGQDIVKMLGLDSGSGSFLLLLDRAGGRLIRLNPQSLETSTRVAGLDTPAAMTFDPLTGDLLVAEFSRVSRVPRGVFATGAEATADAADLESFAAPAGLTGLRGIAFNRCDNSIVVSSAPQPAQSGGPLQRRAPGVYRLEPLTGRVQPMGPVADPGQLLALYRRGLTCPDAFQLLVVDNAEGSIALTIPSMDFDSTWLGGAGAVDLSFIPSPPAGRLPQGSPGVGQTAAVAVGGVDRSGEVAAGSALLAEVPGLYDPNPVNPPAPVRADFDAALDFGATSNPSGAWSYGYTEDFGSTFIAFSGPAEQRLGNISTPGAFFWSFDIPGTNFDFPLLGGNLSGADIQAGTALVPVDRLLAHPGQAGQYAVLRWTSQEAGTYMVRGSFRGLDDTTTDTHVFVGGQLLISNPVSGFGNTVNFSFRVELPGAGVPIDMAVGIGGNSFNFDSTGVQLTLDRID